MRETILESTGDFQKIKDLEAEVKWLRKQLSGEHCGKLFVEVCCDGGGEVGPGCYHDHCKRPSLKQI